MLRVQMEPWKLPQDITSDILLRLPIKSVMRCKCVCKNWRFLLTCPIFVNRHLTRSSLSNNPSLLFSTLDSERTDVGVIKMDLNVYLIEHMVQVTVIDSPLPRLQLPPYYAPSPWLDLHDSCNGLLLLSTITQQNPSMLISNPFTRETLQLPQSNPSFERNHKSCGLGYHPTTKEYKVLRLVFVRSPHSTKLIADVHTLGSTSWRSKGDVPFRISREAYSVHANAALHWLSEYPIGSHFVAISSFDIADEEFQFFFVPPSLSHLKGNWSHIKLQELRGSLCLADFSSGDCIDIWVMKHYAVEDSWIKLFVLPIPGTVGSFSLLWQMEGGKIILEHNENIIVYDPKNNQLAQLEVQVPRTFFRAFVHVGSLISPMAISNQTQEQGRKKLLDRQGVPQPFV